MIKFQVTYPNGFEVVEAVDVYAAVDQLRRWNRPYGKSIRGAPIAITQVEPAVAQPAPLRIER